MRAAPTRARDLYLKQEVCTLKVVRDPSLRGPKYRTLQDLPKAIK